MNFIFKYKVEEVKHFTIRGHGIVKHVYDVKNTALPKTQNITKYKAPGVKSFRIGQFSKKIVRIVIETTVPMNGKYVIDGRKLTLLLPSPKNLENPFFRVEQNKHTTKKSVPKNSVAKKRVSHKTIVRKYYYKASRRNKTIILDAGHGGRDIGASSKGVIEKNLTLSMTLKLKKILKKMGYKVILTRKKDTFMNLKQRTEFANRHKGSLFVSIHANAAPKKRTPKVRYRGIEVFYLSVKNSKRVKNRRAVYHGKKVYSQKAYRTMTSQQKYQHSKKLAYLVKENILKSVKSNYTIYDKGVKRNDFWVLLATKMPSILVETGYLTHKQEVKNLNDTYYQVLLVEGIAKGINRYYGL